MLRVDDLGNGVQFPAGTRVFSFVQSVAQFFWRPSIPLYNRVAEVKRSCHDGDNFLAASTEVKNVWSCTSTSSHDFVYIGTSHFRGNLTLR